MEYNSNLLKSVLLLTLAVSGNFIGNTLSCKSQYHMTNNMMVKHMLLFFIIYFTLSFSSSDIPNPSNTFKNSFIIWVCFLIYTKQDIKFTVISSLLIVGTYILSNYEDYYNQLVKVDYNKQDNENKIKQISKYKNYAYKSIVVVIIAGFLKYLYEKKQEYGENFNIQTFLFGKVTCNSLK